MTPKTHRWRQAPALVVSLVALFAALSGAAVALPGKSTVNSGDIKDNTVKSLDLKDNKAVASADVIDESLEGTDVKDETIASADVANASLTGTDVQDNSLTGADVAEATLGQVPNAATLSGRPAGAFVSSAIYKSESPITAGTALGDGTFYIDRACNAGDVLLSGGPANVNPGSDMVESFSTPGTTNAWRARIDKNGLADNFSVVVLCADQ